jgi:hypothetical protein
MLELLYSALASQFGIRVSTSNLNLLRQKLYALRAKHEELSCLSLVQSPFDPNELWIVKTPKEPSDGPQSP